MQCKGTMGHCNKKYSRPLSSDSFLFESNANQCKQIPQSSDITWWKQRKDLIENTVGESTKFVLKCSYLWVEYVFVTFFLMSSVATGKDHPNPMPVTWLPMLRRCWSSANGIELSMNIIYLLTTLVFRLSRQSMGPSYFQEIDFRFSL